MNSRVQMLDANVFVSHFVLSFLRDCKTKAPALLGAGSILNSRIRDFKFCKTRILMYAFSGAYKLRREIFGPEVATK